MIVKITLPGTRLDEHLSNRIANYCWLDVRKVMSLDNPEVWKNSRLQHITTVIAGDQNMIRKMVRAIQKTNPQSYYTYNNLHLLEADGKWALVCDDDGWPRGTYLSGLLAAHYRFWANKKNRSKNLIASFMQCLKNLQKRTPTRQHRATTEYNNCPCDVAARDAF